MCIPPKLGCMLPWVTAQKWEVLQVFMREIHCFYKVNFAIKLSDHTKTAGTEKIIMETNENET